MEKIIGLLVVTVRSALRTDLRW